MLRIESSLRIEAPPAVVGAFFVRLDHLCYVSSQRRLEWPLTPGELIEDGKEYTVRVQQGGHRLDLRFRATEVHMADADSSVVAGYEFECLTWPFRGALHRRRLEAVAGGEATDVSDLSEWRPPWYLRRVAEHMLDSQRDVFLERLERAKVLIERVYAQKGSRAFADGIQADAAAVEFEPSVVTP